MHGHLSLEHVRHRWNGSCNFFRFKKITYHPKGGKQKLFCIKQTPSISGRAEFLTCAEKGVDNRWKHATWSCTVVTFGSHCLSKVWSRAVTLLKLSRIIRLRDGRNMVLILSTTSGIAWQCTLSLLPNWWLLVSRTLQSNTAPSFDPCCCCTVWNDAVTKAPD